MTAKRLNVNMNMRTFVNACDFVVTLGTVEGAH